MAPYICKKMMSIPRKLPTSLLQMAVLLIVLCHFQAMAQDIPGIDASKGTRGVERSVREKAEEKLAPTPQNPVVVKEKKEEKEKPKGPSFLLTKVNLKGVESVSVSTFEPSIKKYVNTDVSIGDLKVLTKEIEREYLRNGIIAACFIPPQDIKGGVVALRVVEAKMGEVVITQGPFFEKDRTAYYWSIKPGEVLHYDKMSRSLQFMNKNPDREANATLHAGKKPGTTDILLNVKTHFPVHAFFSYDQEGSVSTGRERAGYGFRHNNFLFQDDTLLAGTMVGKDFSGTYFYHTVPITNFGTRLMYGFSDSRSVPKKDLTTFGIESRAQTTSFFMHQDVYKKAEYMGEVAVGLDLKDKSTRWVNGTLNKDRHRILRVKSTLIHRFPGCITYISPQFSQGINVFGEDNRSSLSSRNADNNFSKFDIFIKHKRTLPLDLQANFNLKAQVASERLAPQEEFAMGGIDSVRGYPSQDFLADYGIQTNLELLIPSFWIPENLKLPYEEHTIKESVTSLLFFDYAYGQRRSPSPTEEIDASLAGIGAGIRIRLFNQAMLRFEWGFPIGDPTVAEAANSRFHVSISFEDKLPDEIKRIKKMMEESNIEKLTRKILNDEIKRPGRPIRQKLYKDLSLAQEALRKGKLKEARQYFENIINTTDSLKSQAENYIRSGLQHKKELQEQNKMAQKHYMDGNIEKAKELWQLTIKNAKMEPLVLKL